MKIGVIVAMDKEYDALTSLNDARLIVRKSGIGKVNAAVTAARLIMEHHPDCIVSTGVAGGIDSVLKVMDVVVARNVVYHDYFIGSEGEGTELYNPFPCSDNLIQKAQQLGNPHIVIGQIASGDQFIQDNQKLTEIKSSHPEALAVDMESGAIAHTCQLFGVPFISFRIISDVVGVENHAAEYSNFWETLTTTSFGVIEDYLKCLLAE